MDRAEAVNVLTLERAAHCKDGLVERAIDMAIAALREQEQKRYTAHEVAVILAEFTGDDCACNFNGIDGWLPEKCELLDACPNTVGVACWEQYLKYREHEPPDGGADHE